MTPGDVVRRRGASYRVVTVTDDTATVHGGPRWQTRTYPVDELKPADQRQRDDFERASAKVRAALRSIPRAKALR